MFTFGKHNTQAMNDEFTFSFIYHADLFIFTRVLSICVNVMNPKLKYKTSKHLLPPPFAILSVCVVDIILIQFFSILVLVCLIFSDYFKKIVLS